MRVICISNNQHTDSLTIGKVYDVLNHQDKFVELFAYTYRIIDDDGIEWNYIKEKFKSIEDVRNERLDKILK